MYLFQNSEYDSAILIAPHLMKQTVAICRICNLRHFNCEKIAGLTPVLHRRRRRSWRYLNLIIFENDPTVLMCSVLQELDYQVQPVWSKGAKEAGEEQ